jgi:methionyl-tRNA formyltransferase
MEAADLGLPLIQPEKLSTPGVFQRLQEWAPDVIVVVAFGQILRSDFLGLPARGCVNVHASLLPRWRGAAPIQAAIAAGDRQTGVTIMEMDEGMDTGGIISQRSISIDAQDTGGSLSTKLSQLGAELLPATLDGYLAGDLRARPQDASRATRAPLLKKEDGLLDAALPAEVLERRVRAFDPWPGAYIMWERERLKVRRAHVAGTDGQAGMRVVIGGQPALATTEGLLVLDEVQPPGKKPMNGRAFLMGARVWAS